MSHVPGLSDEAVRECLREGMSTQDIQSDQGRCLDIFWNDQRLGDAFENSGGENLAGVGVSETFSSSTSGKVRRGELPEYCAEPTLDELGSWSDEIPSINGWPPGLSERYNSEMVGRLVSTRPTVNDNCGLGNSHLYSCSASAIRTEGGRDHIILTAAHCLHEGSEGTWHEDAYFYPYWNGVDYMRGNLRGSFPVYRVGVMEDYVREKQFIGQTTEASLHYDFAFAVPGQDAGDALRRSLSDRVVGYDVSFDDSVDFSGVVLGYPSIWECDLNQSPQSYLCVDFDLESRPVKDANHIPTYYPGNLNLGCAGDISGVEMEYVPLGGDEGTSYLSPVLHNCATKGGGSGGPMLSEYSDITGQGVVQAVTVGISDPSNDSGMSVFGRLLDEDARGVYNCVMYPYRYGQNCLQSY